MNELRPSILQAWRARLRDFIQCDRHPFAYRVRRRQRIFMDESNAFHCEI
jgi:hypothetical protein